MWYDILEALFVMKLVGRFFGWLFKALWSLALNIVKLIQNAVPTSDPGPDNKDKENE